MQQPALNFVSNRSERSTVASPPWKADTYGARYALNPATLGQILRPWRTNTSQVARIKARICRYPQLNIYLMVTVFSCLTSYFCHTFYFMCLFVSCTLLGQLCLPRSSPVLVLCFAFSLAYFSPLHFVPFFIGFILRLYFSFCFFPLVFLQRISSQYR